MKRTLKNSKAVNLKQTKIMIFRRGGKPSKNERFIYNEKLVDIVNSYTYLGVPFQTTGIFDAAAGHFKAKGMAAVGTTLNRIKKFQSVNLESVRRVFRSLVRSTTMYAACV